MRLSEAVQGFLMWRAVAGSAHTARDYANTLRQFEKFVGDDPDVAAVDADQVRRFLYWLRVERELAPKTVKNAHTGLSAFWTWLEDAYGLPHVIRGAVRSPKAGTREVVPLSKTDVRLILTAVEKTATWRSEKRAPAQMSRPTRHRDRAIVLLLLDTGVRAQELCDLVVGDVDMKSGVVQVRHGKGDKGRTVYLGVTAKAALWSYLSRRAEDARRPDAALFETKRGQPLDRAALRKMLLGAGQRAEVAEVVNPHRFRHTFAVNYLRNGGDVYTLQRLLGHATMEMVKRYLALAQTDIAEAHRRASPVDNWRLG
jgi:site-specific recombinase XerD